VQEIRKKHSGAGQGEEKESAKRGAGEKKSSGKEKGGPNLRRIEVWDDVLLLKERESTLD